MKPTYVKLERQLTLPKSWRKHGAEATKHIHVDTVEEVGDEAYRFIVSFADEPWYVSQDKVVEVRPPGHPRY